MISVLSERRLNRLLHPALSVGLPAFLTKGAGMFSGLMLSQYTADMLIVEQRILSTPSCIQSIPAAADQEDFVSMGFNGALKTRQILDNAHGVPAIEAIAAAQALDFRDFAPGKGTAAAHAAVRRVVEHLDEDRPLHSDHNAMAAAIERCDLLVEGFEREADRTAGACGLVSAHLHLSAGLAEAKGLEGLDRVLRLRTRCEQHVRLRAAGERALE